MDSSVLAKVYRPEDHDDCVAILESVPEWFDAGDVDHATIAIPLRNRNDKGLLARSLVGRGFVGTIECLDGSSEMLSLAEQDSSGDCRFVLHDLSQPLPYPDGSFGVVTAINVMFCLNDRAAFAREVCRVLKPNGLFLCVMPKPSTEGTGAFLREHFRGCQRGR